MVHGHGTCTWYMVHVLGTWYMYLVHVLGAWYVYMVHAHGTCTWYMYMVHVHGTCIWYMHMIHAYGACIWYMYMVHVYGICMWYMYIVYVHDYVYACRFRVASDNFACGAFSDLSIVFSVEISSMFQQAFWPKFIFSYAIISFDEGSGLSKEIGGRSTKNRQNPSFLARVMSILNLLENFGLPAHYYSPR